MSATLISMGHSCGLEFAGVSCSPAPLAIAGSHRFAMVSAGHSHACGVTDDAAGYCWGFNQTAQLGDATTENRDTPSRIR